MYAAGLMGLARGPAACMNHQFTVASQMWSGDPQPPGHRPLAQIKYEAFVTSAHYRESLFCEHSERCARCTRTDFQRKAAAESPHFSVD